MHDAQIPYIDLNALFNHLPAARLTLTLKEYWSASLKRWPQQVDDIYRISQEANGDISNADQLGFRSYLYSASYSRHFASSFVKHTSLLHTMPENQAKQYC